MSGWCSLKTQKYKDETATPSPSAGSRTSSLTHDSGDWLQLWGNMGQLITVSLQVNCSSIFDHSCHCTPVWKSACIKHEHVQVETVTLPFNVFHGLSLIHIEVLRQKYFFYLSQLPDTVTVRQINLNGHDFSQASKIQVNKTFVTSNSKTLPHSPCAFSHT